MPLTPPAPIVLTADEVAEVGRGEIVVRYASERNGWQAIAVADSAARPQAVMDAVFDLPPRVAEVDFLSGVSIEGWGEAGGVRTQTARWEAGFLGFTRTFYLLYVLDRAAGWCTFTLDESKDNDIDGTDGGYHAYAVPGGSRIVYYNTAPPSGAPNWLQQRLQSSSMREQLAGIRARAEAVDSGGSP